MVLANIAFAFAVVWTIIAIILGVTAFVESRKGRTGWAWLAGIGAVIAIIIAIIIFIGTLIFKPGIDVIEQNPELLLAL